MSVLGAETRFELVQTFRRFVNLLSLVNHQDESGSN